MGKRSANPAKGRPQAQKDTALARVRAVQELRRSSAAEPIPSKARYSRTVKHRANRYED